LSTTASCQVEAGPVQPAPDGAVGHFPLGHFPLGQLHLGMGAFVVKGIDLPVVADHADGDPIDVGVDRGIREQVAGPAYPVPVRTDHHESCALNGSSATCAPTDRPSVTPTLPAGERSSVAATPTRPWRADRQHPGWPLASALD